jgi:hypothetical protein
MNTTINNQDSNIQVFFDLNPRQIAITNLLNLYNIRTWDEFCMSEIRCNAAIEVFRTLNNVPFFADNNHASEVPF